MKGKRGYLLAALIVIAPAGWWLVRSMVLPIGGTGRVYVQIPKGSSAGSIGRMLARHGVLRSAFGFRLLAQATGKVSELKPGAYELSPSMTPMQVLDRIASGETAARWVTFPEGFTVRQIAARLGTDRLANKQRFLELALHGGSTFRTSFSHPGDSLEGYLFPDTYLIPPGSSERAIIREMLKCFERKAAVPFASDMRRSGWRLHDVVTLASLIEREAKVSRDRPLISGVLRNRLSKGMRLECDATVLYALGEHKDRIYLKDLAVDSPYNTYLYVGLPPGPIANPGLNSIRAALHPSWSHYLYYVARGDGSHIFSRNMQEHERARQLARRGGG